MIRALAFLVALLWGSLALASPAIDGSASTLLCSGGSTNILTITGLTTTQTNDAIILHTATGNLQVWVVSVSDTAGLTWTRRAAISANNIEGDRDEEWYAPSASALTGDTITVSFQGPRSGSLCFKGIVVGISGAAWPTPFDPLYNWPQPSRNFGTQSFTTLGTDDLVLARYTPIACGPLNPGIGWSAVANATGDLLEYQIVAGAQTGLTATVSSCSGNVQMSILDAFAAADGLGMLEETPKLNNYAILQTGMGTSKQNMYVIAEPGIGTSKLNTYAVTQTSTTPASGAFGKGGLILHSFPP